MASEERAASHLLETLQRVLPEAREAGFFPVVRLVERLLQGGERIGDARSPDEELIRFCHDPSLGFSTGDVSGAEIIKTEWDPENGIPQREYIKVTSTFMGLCGGVSPLPPYFSDEIAREDPYTAYRRSFLDIFHHRLLSLFYRSAVRFDVPNEFETTTNDIWSRRLLALTGAALDQGPGQLEDSGSELPRWHLLGLAPLLSTHLRTAGSLKLALCKILEAELGELDIDVSQFLGGWMKFGDPQRMCLGVYNCELGKTSILGERVFDPASRIRISIGALSRESYERFLPDGDLFETTRKIVRVFSDDMLEYQLELIMADDSKRAMQLSGNTPVSSLGRNTWIGQLTDQDTRYYVESSARKTIVL